MMTPPLLALLALLPALTALPFNPHTQTRGVPPEQFPQYTLQSSVKMKDGLTADIAGSAFVGVDGQFHWLTSAANYEMTDSGGSFVNTFTADNLAALGNSPNDATRKLTQYKTYWNRPGSYCYQLSKRGIPSAYDDDHCDVIGVWIDPATGTWYGAVNDEYQFSPWGPANQTNNERIKTSLHNNRILLASSKDVGATWDLIDSLVTDPLQPNQTLTPELFPGKTWSYGLSGVRFALDHVNGFAYVLYNTQLRWKDRGGEIIRWYTLARAPLKDGIKPNTWKKYWNGKFTEPGIGGKDGMIDDRLKFNVRYEPKDDFIAVEGTGADGSSVSYQMQDYYTTKVWTFSDVNGVPYSVNMTSKVITRTDANSPVDSVTYDDPQLDRTTFVGKNAAGAIVIQQTDTYGVTTTRPASTAAAVFTEATTHRLYVVPTTTQQTAFSYNVASSRYRGVGYDQYVYENDDLANPAAWTPVGKRDEAVLAHAGYVSQIDTGSMTNQFISGTTFSTISDLYASVDTETVQAPSHTAELKDSDGAKVDNYKPYHLSVGDAKLTVGYVNGQPQADWDVWTLEPIAGEFNKNLASGFYRLKSSKGTYLQVSGATPAAQRAWSAELTVGAAQPEYDASGNGGLGSPGGSDQWHFLPIGGEESTSVNDAVGYKLVNRQSNLVASFNCKAWVLEPNDVTRNDQQKVKISVTG